jgi:hypothetical protein
MACSSDQDQFLWPLNFTNIVRPVEQTADGDESDEVGIRKDWALAEYVDPEDEEQVKLNGNMISSASVVPPETVQVVTRVRYYISERQANEFITSCWYGFILSCFLFLFSYIY